MSRPESPLKSEVIAAIRDLTAKHGVKEGCRMARERYPEIPDGSWGRWRLEAIGSASDQREADGAAAAALASEVREAIPAPEQLAPAVIADPVPAMRRAIDFWYAIDQLESDAQLLREFALTTRADGSTKVRAPFALKDAHKMRVEVLKLGLAQAEAAHTVARMAAFNETVLNCIGEESPACKVRIMKRLQELRLRAEGEARGL